ncbi:MAG TPA: alpha/beta fold hydrolase [Candidatus Saccharimonadales bacterium]|nr:alpha/beta fold hydrolase [Candidatus Saccharimonadales bacterium]
MTPDTHTIEEKMIPVDNGHVLYAQAWGNARAKESIIFLHGGPGSGCSDGHKQYFDPARQQIIFFDQRGSGRSTPAGLLKANDTDHAVEDINTIANTFGLERFTLVGGSWGSCLALTYAIRYPDRVQRMVLRGLFTGRQSEINYLDQGQFRPYFPEVWEAFANGVPAEFKADPAGYHFTRILGKNQAEAKQSAYAYAHLENALVGLDDRRSLPKYEDFDPTGTIVECHFTGNACFLPDGYIMDHAKELTMPIVLVQGRYDSICPPITAYELFQRLPKAQLLWTTAGHSGNDRANWDVVKAALSSY